MEDNIAFFLGSWASSITLASIVFRIFVSVFFSALIGWERSVKRHSAGLRTFIIVSIAGTVASLLDTFLEMPMRLLSIAAIISVVRIARSSIFFDSRKQMMGLTTSVALWTTCIIGVAVGSGVYTIALACFIALISVLSVLPAFETYLKDRSNHFEIHLELKNPLNLQNFITTIRKLGLTIDSIELNPAYKNSGLSVYSIAISISSNELKKYKTHKQIIEALSTIEYVHYITEI